MGCDIHLFLEYKGSDESNYWINFIASPYLPRDYELFNHIAGVRAHDKTLNDINPRGLPENITLETRKYLLRYIKPDNYKNFCEYYTIQQSEIDKLIDLYNKSPGFCVDDFVKTDEFGEKYTIDPDYHHVTWLTGSEYIGILRKYKLYLDATYRIGKFNISFHYKLIESIVNQLMKNYGKNNVRLIIGFDN